MKKKIEGNEEKKNEHSLNHQIMKQCSLCEKYNANLHCQICKEFICEKCSKNKCKGHKVTKCNFCQKRIPLWYCEICKEFLCILCHNTKKEHNLKHENDLEELQ